MKNKDKDTTRSSLKKMYKELRKLGCSHEYANWMCFYVMSDETTEMKKDKLDKSKVII